jgi:hypothetical protein
MRRYCLIPRFASCLVCRFVDLETLIRLKRAAGRPKDFERIAELEVLWKEQLTSNE